MKRKGGSQISFIHGLWAAFFCIRNLNKIVTLTESSKSPAEVAKSNKQWVGTLTKLYQNYPNKIMDFFQET